MQCDANFLMSAIGHIPRLPSHKSVIFICDPIAVPKDRSTRPSRLRSPHPEAGLFRRVLPQRSRDPAVILSMLRDKRWKKFFEIKTLRGTRLKIESLD